MTALTPAINLQFGQMRCQDVILPRRSVDRNSKAKPPAKDRVRLSLVARISGEILFCSGIIGGAAGAHRRPNSPSSKPAAAKSAATGPKLRSKHGSVKLRRRNAGVAARITRRLGEVGLRYACPLMIDAGLRERFLIADATYAAIKLRILQRTRLVRIIGRQSDDLAESTVMVR